MKYFVSIFIILAFSSYVFSQNQEKEIKQIGIDICQPSLTEAGRQSSFQFSYIYLVNSDENGLIKSVKEILDNKSFKHLVNDEKLILCIEKWKLKSSEKYIVKIDVGTTGIERFLSISSKTVKIKILL